MNRTDLARLIADDTGTGRNPQAGETLEIPAGRQVRLRPGSRLKGATRTGVGG